MCKPGSAMNTTSTSFSSDYSWLNPGSRRNSIESILSIQGKETDVVRDTSDTDSLSSRDVEYEPASEPETAGPVSGDSDSDSEDYIIKTRVIEVRVLDDGDLEFADSEQTESDGSDSEADLRGYRQCAQCRATNDNPLYRYCEKCFKVRKNFFPPRPKRKKSVHKLADQDSGVDSACASQELSQNLSQNAPSSQNDTEPTTKTTVNVSEPNFSKDVILRRRAESADRTLKRKRDSESDSNSDVETKRGKTNDTVVVPLMKTVSDPSLTIDTVDSTKSNDDNMCIVCVAEPKSGVFVHGRIAHICCCYKCALKVWAKSKRCPICNCKVSTVLKAVVM